MIELQWVTSVSTAIVAIGVIVTAIRGPFKKLHEDINQLDTKIDNLDSKVGDLIHSQQNIAGLIKTALSPEVKELADNILPYPTIASKK